MSNDASGLPWVYNAQSLSQVCSITLSGVCIANFPLLNKVLVGSCWWGPVPCLDVQLDTSISQSSGAGDPPAPTRGLALQPPWM